MGARRRRAAAGSGDERGRWRTGGVREEIGGAWVPVSHLEHAGVVGGGGEAPERAGDDDPRRRKEAPDGSDLG